MPGSPSPSKQATGKERKAAPDELQYDPDVPPRDPPPGANPTLWRLAYLVYEAHWRRADGFCNCGELWLCGPAQLAREQMRVACHIGPSGTAEDRVPVRQVRAQGVNGDDAMPEDDPPHEVDDPMATPPADAAQPVHLLWQLAHLLRELHQPRASGRCVNCGQPASCDGARIADEAWRLARKWYARQHLQVNPPDRVPRDH